MVEAGTLALCFEPKFSVPTASLLAIGTILLSREGYPFWPLVTGLASAVLGLTTLLGIAAQKGVRIIEDMTGHD